MHEDLRRQPLLLIPPPLLFAGTFLGARAVDARLPLRQPSGARPLKAVGLGLLAAGAASALGSVGLFARARTTVVPHGRARTLVTGGTYRFTRNPMYVGLVLAYLGAAAVTRWLWPVLLLPLPVLTLQRVVIPLEERRLTELFGDAYAAYCRQVRRWV